MHPVLRPLLREPGVPLAELGDELRGARSSGSRPASKRRLSTAARALVGPVDEQRPGVGVRERPAGYRAEDLADPHEQFVQAGHPVDIDDHAAVVLPGGHGPVVDPFRDADLGRLPTRADECGTLIGGVRHGAAALLSAVDDEGRWRFAGRELTAFTDEEEQLFGTAEGLRGYCPPPCGEERDALRRGRLPGVHRPRRDLFTGQNPASGWPMADAMIAAPAE